MPALISILVPAYNHEKYVEGCVRSVLAQDWPNVELLVVDDGSQDATWAKLQALKAECERKLTRVEMVTQENRGTSFTWARLRGMARGDFVLTLASDDELAPGALSALVKPMLRDRRIGVVVGQNAFMDGDGRACYWNRTLETVYNEVEACYRSLNEAICEWAHVKQFSRQFGDYGKLLKDNYIANGCLIRAAELASITFPTEQVPLEDYWVHLQLVKHTRYKSIPEMTFRYRWHAANTSHAREKMKEMTRRIYDFEEKCLREQPNDKYFETFMSVRYGVRLPWTSCYKTGIARQLLDVTYRMRRRMLKAGFGVRKHAAYVSLGYNCETSYRYFARNGFCESGLFQWSYAYSLDDLIYALENLDKMFTGVVEGPDLLYRCANTKIEQHGKIDQHEWINGVTDANRAKMEADRADLLGRMAHLKEKLRRTLSAGGALVTYKMRTSEAFAPDCEEKLNGLLRALRDLGARDFDFVLICEKWIRSRHIRLAGERMFVRYVEKFNPDTNAVSGSCGDNDGWQLIFSEFQPCEKKSQAHKFKFEKE